MTLAVSSVESVSVIHLSQDHLSQDTRRFIRAGLWVMGVGFFGFILWAAWAPLDQGIPVSGTMMVEGQRKTLHHPTGAQVERILVSEGQSVAAGQLLIQMNDTQIRSQAESLRLQLDDAIAQLVRLRAERDQASDMSLPVNWQGADEVVQNQRALFSARRAALVNAQAVQRESVAALEHQLSAAKESLIGKKKQSDALAEQLVGIRQLAGKGHVSRNQLLEMERFHAQVETTVAEEIGRVGQLQRQIQEGQLRQQAVGDDFQRDVLTQFSDTKLRVEALTEHYQAAQYELANTRILAPVDGVVTGLAVFTEGGFVAREAQLLDVVPHSQQLLAEGQAPVHLVDSLRPGLVVNLMFSAFNQAITPQIPAEVITVSADSMVDSRTGIPYYRVQARVTQEGMEKLAQHQIRPGMPVEMFVKTGERSMLSYLFKPLRDRTRMAMSE